MPELPEVHALAADLASRMQGRTVERLELVSFSALKTFEPPLSALHGLPSAGVGRRGKYLDMVFGDLHLVMHLARAGWVRWRDAAPTASARPGRGPLAARLVLDDGSGFDVTEAGTKKSLAIHLVRDPLDIERVATLGPEPLDPAFTVDVLAGILGAQGRSQIKGVLRSQSIIAGIGNAYSDEILHAAKMSPYKSSAMNADEIAQLHAAIQATLRAAIAREDGLRASELKQEKKSNLQVHGRNGLPCPVCGDTVRQVRFADSSLEYCPTCQTGGKPLADRVLSRLLK